MEKQMVMKCRRCGRGLRAEASITAGIGPVCSRKEAADARAIDVEADSPVAMAVSRLVIYGIEPVIARELVKRGMEAA